MAEPLTVAERRRRVAERARAAALLLAGPLLGLVLRGLQAAGLVDGEVRETQPGPRAGGLDDRPGRLPGAEGNACCAPVEHETCCEPAAKTDCCGAAAVGARCGCR